MWLSPVTSRKRDTRREKTNLAYMQMEYTRGEIDIYAYICTYRIAVESENSDSTGDTGDNVDINKEFRVTGRIGLLVTGDKKVILESHLIIKL